MQTVGLPLPTLHEHTGSVLMTFMLPKQLGGVSEGVSALVALITQHQGMRVPALAEVLNTSPKNLERWLKQLREAGQIEFIGSPKTGGYYPK
ncbi:MAG: helix-turn-helix domain-containing protein [Chlorobiaceae bacterium]|nr:helix-turn-helix domain-containing protein [Chlorobiaceae bacterium]